MDGPGNHLYNSNMDSPAIQNFNLFGEVGELPDVVHCETIETRSQLHDWELTPHRHMRLHQVLLIEKGAGTATIEAESLPLQDGYFVNVPAGTVHGFSFAEDTEGWVMTLGMEILDELLDKRGGLRPVLDRCYVGKSTGQMRATMRLAFEEYSARQFARAHISRMVSGYLLGLVARQIAENDISKMPTSSSSLQGRFEALLEDHYLEHWSTRDYADALGVSATHLSRVMRTASGEPASKIIEARMIREARRQLVYTRLSVSQVAYTLGYSDPAYFSRVFSRATGLSPSSFRERLEKTAW